MIILLHGALATSAEMEPLRKLLPPDTQSLTFVGHDSSTSLPATLTITTFVEQLEGYFKAHHSKNVTVVGHSLGGYVALAHASQYEDSPICRIVTYGTKFDWSAPQLANMLATLHPENEALMEYLKKKFAEKSLPLLLATTHMMAHIERLDGLLPADLADVAVPVDVVVGDKDKVVSVTESERVVKALPQGQFHVLKDSRHELERSDLAGLVRIILGQ